MKSRAFIILVAVLLLSLLTFGATQEVGFKPELGLSGEVVVTTTDAQFLTVPAGATHARFMVETNPVCYSLGSDLPNPAGGGKWPAGYTSKEENDRLMLQRVRLITCTGSGPATVHVYYSRDRRRTD